jgi:hypothetical protein
MAMNAYRLPQPAMRTVNAKLLLRSQLGGKRR